MVRLGLRELYSILNIVGSNFVLMLLGFLSSMMVKVQSMVICCGFLFGIILHVDTVLSLMYYVCVRRIGLFDHGYRLPLLELGYCPTDAVLSFMYDMCFGDR